MSFRCRVFVGYDWVDLHLPLQSTGAVIVNNFVAGTFRSPSLTDLWVQPMASFFLSAPPALFTDNLAAGSEDAGVVIVPDTCGVASPSILRNEVHSAMVGFFLLSVGTTCVEARSLVAWACSHVGILTVDQLANIELRGVVVADNHIGVSLNFVRGGYGYGMVFGSLVMGTSPDAASCADNMVCRAMTKGDVAGVGCNSVYGAGWRRVGIMSSQYTNLGKTCGVSHELPVCRPVTTPVRMCSMPWEKRYGLPNDINSADLVGGVPSAAVSCPSVCSCLFVCVLACLLVCLFVFLVACNGEGFLIVFDGVVVCSWPGVLLVAFSR